METESSENETASKSSSEGKIRIAILGGGVAGVVLANELARSTDAFRIDLIEREDRLGGLHHSPCFDGMHFDIGTFVLHSTHNLLQSMPEVMEVLSEVDYSPVAITPKNTIDRYPVSPKGFVRDHGLLVALKVLCEIPICKLRYWRKPDLVSYIKYYIGGTLYEKSGLRAYIERLYQSKDSEIDIEFALKRLDYLVYYGSVRVVTRRFFANLFSRETFKWLARPAGGFLVMYQKAEGVLGGRGVTVLKGYSIKSIEKAGSDFVLRSENEERRYKRVFSSIPVGITARLTGIPINSVPRFTKLLSLFYTLDGEWNFPQEVLFNYSLDGEWKRVTIFDRYYGRQNGKSYFTVECTFNDEEIPDPEAFVAAKRNDFETHIAKLGLFEGKLTSVGSQVTPFAYPLYTREQLDISEDVSQKVEEFGIELVGRQGKFDYSTSNLIAAKSAESARAIVSQQEVASARNQPKQAPDDSQTD